MSSPDYANICLAINVLYKRISVDADLVVYQTPHLSVEVGVLQGVRRLLADGLVEASVVSLRDVGHRAQPKENRKT